MRGCSGSFSASNGFASAVKMRLRKQFTSSSSYLFVIEYYCGLIKECPYE
ncbi:hypothetical protein VII00023_09621 [Vibrio ichthyoenteri ATCC 700023]|uniref:Uncharacterized protein n=1 Tax=Vibrio ichthyoenteri ATCC 700023 TaxID=870968 RepID=F9RZ41_9VIBR|nr:hypothetical protein VII00023_09621 [Vibrio ichthyoenteri ATCC 700023]